MIKKYRVTITTTTYVLTKTRDDAIEAAAAEISNGVLKSGDFTYKVKRVKDAID
jgi:hypothetical protein